MRVARIRCVGLTVFWVLTCAGAAPSRAADPVGEPLQVLTAVVGDKNVFIPSTLVLAAGPSAGISIFNATGKPHGFAIPALGVEAVIPEQIEHHVDLPTLSPGLYRIHCQLHEAHRSASLLVVSE